MQNRLIKSENISSYTIIGSGVAKVDFYEVYRYMTTFNYGINAWKLYLTFSSPFIARKPHNNRNKLCVFFYYNTKSHLSVHFEIKKSNNKCVLRSFICSEATIRLSSSCIGINYISLFNICSTK